MSSLFWVLGEGPSGWEEGVVLLREADGSVDGRERFAKGNP